MVATYYFTKWVEAIPLKMVTSKNMIDFVREHIVYRFGIPQTITIDQGTMFTSEEFRDFAASMRIKLLNSSPYYAQNNGQAEASNQIMIKLIKKKIEEQPRKWHSTLNEALWAYRMAYHGSIKMSPYELGMVTMQSFLGRFKLDRGVSCCKMICQPKSTRIL